MKTSTAAMLTLLSLTMSAATSSASDVKVEHLGVNNTLVRVNSDGRYLMMPVQESNDDATVNVLVDGRLDRTIYVRMAKSKVDYSVPLDLSPYKGNDVVLNIITTQARSDIREAKGDACWTNFTVTDTVDTSNREKYRPAFHHSPLYGWMNDPNGMVYTDGRWHLYYQTNPYGSKWQNMTWGHSSSPDLINWEHHPVAIEPDGLGTIFSGSCAVDSTNSAGFGKDAIIALYTSAAASQIQSLAWSNDGGMTFNKYPGNPVVTLESEARDPNMFWDKANNRWVLVLAHALEHEMLIFTSPDMKEWTLESAFGKGLGAQGGVWECPDLFPLKIDGTGDTKWVLLCNLNPGGPFGGSGTQYFIGDFDGKTFTPDTDAQGNVPTKWLDHGKDHYATVSWSDAPDGRRTVIGWMSNWQYAAEVPTKQFRSANTLPREMQLFRDTDGELYVASVPSPELEALRASTFRKPSSMSAGTKERKINLPTANDGICEILLTVDPRKASDVIMTLANNAGEHVTITYDVDAQTLAFDRRKSGVTDFSQDFPAVTVTPVHSRDGLLNLRMFVDRASIELFANGGRAVMTNLVFPTSPYSTMTVKAVGGNARISDLTVYSLKPTAL
ncbi:MAG TPA: GH32 C-terminal domain-containing protein [Candidatus Amulumruptor caecigallinarius]|uniref:GH32 C-terminal domain-containing protein n=1 Tax=Candidatus Amulumruptor caecigallinarius TaxID=2109911 RepID=A0A921EA51_9BACT|nr:GH32 C-terminal domain-containing protein [Candidatus Amulumruptor caecigallinarius]